MPYLYGKERKDKIRSDRAKLRVDLSDEQHAHFKTRQDLRLARAKIAEQAAQIERMKQFLQSAISEADRDIGPNVVERYNNSFKSMFARVAAEAN